MFSSATLNIGLRGSIDLFRFDDLFVNGSLILDRTVNVAMVNGFSQVVSNMLPVLFLGGRTGQFATLLGISLGGGRVLDPFYNTSNFLLLTVV